MQREMVFNGERHELVGWTLLAFTDWIVGVVRERNQLRERLRQLENAKH